MSESQAGATCPVKSIDMNTPRSPALSHYALLDGCQDEARPVFRNSEAGFDYWVFTDNSVILDGLQHPELWSSAVIVPSAGEIIISTTCCRVSARASAVFRNPIIASDVDRSRTRGPGRH